VGSRGQKPSLVPSIKIMSFRGLFVGIDRYQSPSVKRLSCACRDATALYALFTDTLGTGGVRLLDSEATKANIVAQLEDLTKCHADDVVVLSFSGHGSTTHELVTHDAAPFNLKGTCLSLEELGTWFTKIPAKRLICFLDCCFSGELGAKVLTTDLASRDHRSAEALLEQMAGEGRIIFTASAGDEPAWENQKLGHGIMTGFLLQALQGVEEVLQAGKISVLRLLQYVTTRVVASASSHGHPQNPTIKGKFEGELTWPPFVPGDQYRAAFPELSKAKVTGDLASLESHGFPKELLATWGKLIPSLNQLQQDAINDFGLLDGDNLIVSAPTSSGKTLIAELAALRGALVRKRSFILLPLKALVNDKYEHFRRVYGEFGIETIRATGEISDDIPALMLGQYDICLMTYEKFSALVLGNPYLLEEVGSVAIDEVQMIADKSRGLNLEFVLTYLKLRAQQGTPVQIIALSAVIGDTKGLENWLDARLLRREVRPVPLNEGIIRHDGSFRYLDSKGEEKVIPRFVQPEYRKGSSQDYIIPLARKLVKEKKQVIVFREKTGEAVGCAGYLAANLGLPASSKAIAELPSGDPSKSSRDLRAALQGGVAFHNSNLERFERSVVESHFRAKDSAIKVLAATTTLAMGINTPAEAVIIAGLMHPPNDPYTVAEYKNMVGRAGRLGFSEEGFSFLLALTPNEEQAYWRDYVLAKPEDLTSRFLDAGTDLRSIIIRVLAALQRATSSGIISAEITAFLSASFGAHRAKFANPHWQWRPADIQRALQELLGAGLLEGDVAGQVRLTPLGRFCGEAGVHVKSALRVIEAVRAMDPAKICDPTLLTLTQLTVELNEIYLPINSSSTDKEPNEWPRVLRTQGVAAVAMSHLQRQVDSSHDVTKRAKRAVACLYWISGKPIAEIEVAMTQFGGGTKDVAGAVRQVVNRTADLLDVVGRIATHIHPGVDFGKRIARLNVRLQVGVSSQMTDVARVLGALLGRGEYMLLQRNGLDAVEKIREAADDLISSCLESDQAAMLIMIRKLTAFREEPEVVVPALEPYQP